MGVAWRPVTFARAKNKQTNKQDESRKPFFASKQASWMNLPAFIYFLITNRDETRLPPAAPDSATATAAPLDPHSTLDWPGCCCCCCCAKHLTPKVSKTTLALLTRLLAANLPVHSLPPPLPTLPTPSAAALVSGNLLKNIKKPAPRVNEKRTRRDRVR